jgi:ABC-2 type transport system permease protein
MRTIRAYLETLVAVGRDIGILTILVGAPLFYSILYPLPYKNEIATAIPVAVVDQDASALSRQIARNVAASPRLHLIATYADVEAARRALINGRILGALILPHGLERDVQRRRQAHAVAFGNGAYFLVNKTVLAGFYSSVLTVSAQIDLRYRLASGANLAQARAQRDPLAFDARPLFNPQEGYANYVVPAVAILIVHQTIVIGVGMFLATRRERRPGKSAYPLAQYVGETLAFTTIGFASTLYYCGFVDWFWDYPRGGNLPGTIAFAALFALAASLFGMTLGSFFDRRERPIQVWVFTSILLLFVSGYPWPASSLPPFLQGARWIFPSTAGILGFTKLAQMNASWNQVHAEVFALSAMIVVLAVPAWLLVRSALQDAAREEPAA